MTNITSVSDGYNQYISLEDYYKILWAFTTVIYPTSIIFGLISNTINVIVFTKIGLRDPVTISYLTLSLSDLAYLLLNAVVNTCYAIRSNVSDLPVDVRYLAAVVFNYEGIFYEYSILTTTYIAMTKCCVVAMALKFKNVFTRSRTVGALGVIFIVNLTLHVPMLMSVQLGIETDAVSNTTRWVMIILNQADEFKTFHHTVNQNIVPYTCTCIVVISMGILLYKLIMASRKRHLMQRPNRSKTAATEKDVDPIGVSKKDLQVIKCVVLVSLVFVLNVLYIAARALSRLLIPELVPLGKYWDIFSLLLLIEYSVIHANAGINAVIYFNFNTKYRDIFLKIFNSWFQCVRAGQDS